LIELITKTPWSSLKAEAENAHRPSAVAVGYFGKGASKLLPLSKGSRLVVDASETAVKSGQTCPAELKQLVQKKGVRVYSIENLHAKVFVLGSTAFIGSTNVSKHSAETLIEAVVATTDHVAVKAARQFVRELCLHELGPMELDRLQQIYRPPQITWKIRSRKQGSKSPVRPALPRFYLEQEELASPPEGSEEVQKAGMREAKKHMDKPRGHELKDFWLPGQCRYHKGDLVMQVLEESTGRKMVTRPGKVVHIEEWRSGTKIYTFVYLELRRSRRMALERLAKKLGPGMEKRLLRRGQVSRELNEQLLTAWSD
jgi:hypothetical protein